MFYPPKLLFKALCQSSTIILILSSNIYKVNNYLSQSSSLMCSINFLQPWWYVYFEILLGFRIKSSFILITHFCSGIARGHRWHDRGEPFSHAEWPKAIWTWERSPRWFTQYIFSICTLLYILRAQEISTAKRKVLCCTGEGRIKAEIQR